MKIGTFIIIKNESEYVGYHIMSILDNVDEMVFADGNSTDGTLEIIDYIKRKYDKHNKIKLFLDKDCKDLKDDYVRLFNWTLGQVKSDYVWFIHPDMICTTPELIRPSLNSNSIRYKVNILSVAGDNREYLISSGRNNDWATIYHNSFGIHYFGNYGSLDEDCYFKDITGDEHIFWQVRKYMPYQIENTGITLVHYCDTKPYERRLGRMVECLLNQRLGINREQAIEIAKAHPRVTLKNGIYYKSNFIFDKNAIYPPIFDKYKDEFEPLRKR